MSTSLRRHLHKPTQCIDRPPRSALLDTIRRGGAESDRRDSAQEAPMNPAQNQDVSRRRFVQLATASAIMLAEAGRAPRAAAEDKFIFASTGGSWGEGIKSSFIAKPDFEKRFKVTATHAAQLE